MVAVYTMSSVLSFTDLKREKKNRVMDGRVGGLRDGVGDVLVKINISSAER